MSKITYLGHSAVFIEINNKIIAIDPWLSGNPLCPTQFLNPVSIDLIILTHGHSDHASDAPRLAKHCGANIAATWELAMIMGKEGVSENKLIPMNKGGSHDFEGITISLTNALHSSSYDLPSGPVYAGEACGAIVRHNNTSIYHAGDTCIFSDMRLIGEIYNPTVALLPIGDRFTMDAKQAAHAARLIGCKIAIPIHYKTFPQLASSADIFKTECHKFGIEVVELNPGESLELS